MKICTKCNTPQAITEFYTEAKAKDGLMNKCKACCKVSSQAKYEVKAQQLKDYSNSYRKLNRDKYVAACRAWYKSNKEQEKLNMKAWKEENRGKANAIEAKRRTAKLNAIPKWITEAHLDQIQAIYRLSSTLTKLTGTEYHVDHIIPLQGKHVCGLHIPSNLRIISKTENLKKGNKLKDISSSSALQFKSIRSSKRVSQ